MARQRMIRCEFFTDRPALNRLSADARLLLIRCSQLADDQGLLHLDGHVLKSECFKFQDMISPADVNRLVDQLEHANEILSYSVHGERYGMIINFFNDQRIEKPSKMRYPAPDWTDPRVADALAHRDGWICTICTRPIASGTLGYDGEGPHVLPASPTDAGHTEPSRQRVAHRACATGVAQMITISDVPTLSLFPELAVQPVTGTEPTVKPQPPQEDVMGSYTDPAIDPFTLPTPAGKHDTKRDIKLDPRFAPDAEQLCQRLHDHLSELLTAAAAKQLKPGPRWIRDMIYLLKVDGVTVEQVQAVMDWVHQDPFWRSNIQSPRKLRQHFTRISLDPRFLTWANARHLPYIASAAAANTAAQGNIHAARPAPPRPSAAPEAPAMVAVP